jgi:hypothetical protein
MTCIHVLRISGFVYIVRKLISLLGFRVCPNLRNIRNAGISAPGC